eukprot:4541107-Pleurochrysis_carterae.AAC.3
MKIVRHSIRRTRQARAHAAPCGAHSAELRRNCEPRLIKGCQRSSPVSSRSLQSLHRLAAALYLPRSHLPVHSQCPGPWYGVCQHPLAMPTQTNQLRRRELKLNLPRPSPKALQPLVKGREQHLPGQHRLRVPLVIGAQSTASPAQAPVSEWRMRRFPARAPAALARRVPSTALTPIITCFRV